MFKQSFKSVIKDALHDDHQTMGITIDFEAPDGWPNKGNEIIIHHDHRWHEGQYDIHSYCVIRDPFLDPSVRTYQNFDAMYNAEIYGKEFDGALEDENEWESQEDDRVIFRADNHEGYPCIEKF
jgi:hypothetical protein